MIIVQTIVSRWKGEPGPEVLPLPNDLLEADDALAAHRVEFCEGQHSQPFVTVKVGALDILPPYRFGETAQGMLVFYGKNNPWWPELSDSVPFITLRKGQIARLEHTRASAWKQMHFWRQIDHIVCCDRPRARVFLDRQPTIHKVSVDNGK